MNLPAAIALNKSALAGIVARLFAMLGLNGNAALTRIPVDLHRSIARVLRPAESAVRRLIVLLAKFTKVKTPPPRSMPVGFVRAGDGPTRLAFNLFDPRQRFHRPQRQAENSPRPQPRISFFAEGEVRTIAWGQDPHDVAPQPQNSEADPANLLRRLAALKAALDDLPRQAKRLVRVLARRQKSSRLKLRMPLRPGRAPGYRRKPLLEIDHVLHQCDWLAREALAPDTS